MLRWAEIVQASPIRAARLTAGSAEAPIQIGGAGRCTDRATTRALRNWKYCPSKSTTSWVSRARVAVTSSSNRVTRPLMGTPKASNSFGIQPSPRPNRSRPPVMASSVAASSASCTGFRAGETMTRGA